MAKLNLPRDMLAKIAQGNQRAVAALEQVFENVGDTFPSTIEEANALAGSALAVAQASAAALVLLAEALARLDTAPAAVPHIEADDTAPRVHLGTIAAQNADAVEITGGTAALSTISASGQITSTVATGTAPLVVASTTVVTNLHAAVADSLGTATTYPANATDLASCIALANALKAANTAKGV